MMESNNQNRLTVLEHLAELRRVVLWSAMLILIVSAIVHIYRVPVIGFLLKPLGQDAESLQFLSPLDPLFFILKIDFTLGFLIVLPIILLLVWHFVAPGTKVRVWHGLLIICITSILAMIGAWYSYQVVVPIVLNFMTSLVLEGTVVSYTAQGYINFLLSTTILLVLVFQIPLVIVLLSLLSIIDPKVITDRRAYVYSGAFIVAAVITPTTDVITLFLVALPAIIVTELGAWVARLLR